MKEVQTIVEGDHYDDDDIAIEVEEDKEESFKSIKKRKISETDENKTPKKVRIEGNNFLSPTNIDSSKRERKQVERLDLSAAKKIINKIDLSDGKGEKLSELPRIEFQINKIISKDLLPLHRIIFGVRPHKTLEVKKNIRQFSGFSFDKDSDEYKKRLDMLLNRKMLSSSLKQICHILDLSVSGTKDEIAGRILNFLSNPQSSGKKLTMPGKKKSKSSKSPKNKKSPSKQKTKSPRSKKTAKPKSETNSSENEEASESESESEKSENDDSDEKRTLMIKKKNSGSNNKKPAPKPVNLKNDSGESDNDDDDESHDEKNKKKKRISFKQSKNNDDKIHSDNSDDDDNGDEEEDKMKTNDSKKKVSFKRNEIPSDNSGSEDSEYKPSSKSSKENKSKKPKVTKLTKKSKSDDDSQAKKKAIVKKKKEKSTDCDSALIPLLCVHG